jgi:uncharacterized surface protein with fasciclin (FAS1) repeats
MFRKLSLLLAVLALAIVSVGTPARAQDKPTKTIAELATENKDLSTLLAAVKAADPVFLTILSAKEGVNVTVFAPTNAAFDALFKALNVKAEDVLKNKGLLNTLLSYHVVTVDMPAASVVAANGAYIGTALDDTGVADKTNFPRSAVKVMVADKTVTIETSSGGKAKVAAADVMALNGVVHVVDAVLVPDNYAKTAEMLATFPAANPKAVSLAETVINSTKATPAEFTTLLAAVQNADPAFVYELANGPSYTVFAPTDKAFAATITALKTTPEALLKDKDTLNAVLALHLVPGNFTAKTIIAAAGKDGFKLATVIGVPLMITSDGKGVMVNGTIKVAAADVEATNGIVHVIDGVILPTPAK